MSRWTRHSVLEPDATLSQVVGVHIDPAFLRDGLFDLVAAGTIARCGYRGDYAQVTSLFEMLRPTAAETTPARSG